MQRGRKPNQRYLNTSKCFTIENIGTVILINLARWCLKSYKIAPDSVVYLDCYRSYHALDVSDFYHERINHSKLFATGKNHINGIENFWNQAKRVLREYNGIPKE